MNLKLDIEIAQNIKELPIKEITQKTDLRPEEIELHGNDRTKINWKGINCIKKNQKFGKLILITSISPIPAGEGKPTITIGLGDAIRNQLHKNTLIALREPSMGPVLGLKGGATGSGYAQIVPIEDINLHFTGDMHALTSAIGILTALADNYIYQDNSLELGPNRILLKRGIDANDRTLRKITIGQGSRFNGIEHEVSSAIAVVDELMAILCLATDTNDLEKRIGNALVGFSVKDEPVYVKDLGFEGVIAALLSAVLKLNLVQTLEHTSAIVYGGPFVNIAHGASSVVVTSTASYLSDYVLTEAGSGTNLSGQRFMGFVSNHLDKRPDAVVVVVTVRALKYQAEESTDHLGEESIPASEEGFANLKRYMENMAHYGVSVIVLINKFTSDTDQELNKLKELVQDDGFECEIVSYHDEGSRGGVQVAEKAAESVDKVSDFKPVYKPEDSVEDRIAKIAHKIYYAKNIEYFDTAKKQPAEIKKMGKDELPVIIAKTQCSFADKGKVLGASEDFILHVKDLALKNGAGFIVVATGSILDIPGLPKYPAVLDIDVDNNGKISGLS